MPSAGCHPASGSIARPDRVGPVPTVGAVSALRRIATALLVVTTASAVGLVLPVPARAAPAPHPNPRQWHLSETWAVETEVWPHSQGEGVVVAVLDSGVGGVGGVFDMPEMHDVTVPGGSFMPGGGDGRGDTNGQGTEIAQLIAARGVQGGFAGLAPKAKILPVAIIALSQVEDAIRFAVDHGAKVISVTLSGYSGYSDDLCPADTREVVDYAIEHDVVVVSDAGNEGHKDNLPLYPGACPGVLAVGAVTKAGQPWLQTNRQAHVSVAAPGAGVVVRDIHQEVGTRDGTVFATALVAATAALVRAKFPDLSAREVVQRITATAQDTGPKGRDDLTGYGVVDPAKALAADVPPDAPNPAFEALDAYQDSIQDRKRNVLLLKIGGGLCVGLALLVPVLLLIWSVRRNRRRARAVLGPPAAGTHFPVPGAGTQFPVPGPAQMPGQPYPQAQPPGPPYPQAQPPGQPYPQGQPPGQPYPQGQPYPPGPAQRPGQPYPPGPPHHPSR
ncbi:S8 family serine peptidase [Plantactinospora solaniradicis]|uniref:S8 family serine peptidase n=1 Tax=Plantactinospora solaniradicis TaxID=1723736 RepID=A0ABW1KFV9_9ACTN